MEKHLIINAATVNMLRAKPETLKEYDLVNINCSVCITNPESRQLLAQGKININTAKVINLDVKDDIQVVKLNGLEKMKGAAALDREPALLVCNGALFIEEGEAKSLGQYKAVLLNGVVLHPASFDTSNITLNGANLAYPDGAIVMLQKLELDNAFINSAVSGATYYVLGVTEDVMKSGGMNGDMAAMMKNIGISAVEPLDLDLLKSKGIRFNTPWITVAEENAQVLLPLVEGNYGSTIIPAGYKLMEKGRLDFIAVRRFGKRIFVKGDLEITNEDGNALSQVESLVVLGNVRISEKLLDAFLSKCDKFGNLMAYKGEYIAVNGEEYTMSSELLEDLEEGATFSFTDSMVQIPAEVSSELIRQKIHKICLHSSALTISLHQQMALRKLVENKEGNLSVRENAKEPEPQVEDPNVVKTRINCSYYVL